MKQAEEVSSMFEAMTPPSEDQVRENAILKKMFCEKAKKRSGHIGSIVRSIDTLEYHCIVEIVKTEDRETMGFVRLMEVEADEVLKAFQDTCDGSLHSVAIALISEKIGEHKKVKRDGQKGLQGWLENKHKPWLRYCLGLVGYLAQMFPENGELVNNFWNRIHERSFKWTKLNAAAHVFIMAEFTPILESTENEKSYIIRAGRKPFFQSLILLANEELAADLKEAAMRVKHCVQLVLKKAGCPHKDIDDAFLDPAKAKSFLTRAMQSVGLTLQGYEKVLNWVRKRVYDVVSPSLVLALCFSKRKSVDL
jgi:hypothetical protein